MKSEKRKEALLLPLLLLLLFYCYCLLLIAKLTTRRLLLATARSIADGFRDGYMYVRLYHLTLLLCMHIFCYA